MLLNGKLNIPGGMSELEVREAVTAMAEKNKVYKTVLRGAGAYRHFIPAVVKSITSREELVTCYTPYQAEIESGRAARHVRVPDHDLRADGHGRCQRLPLRRRDRRRRDHPHVPRPQAHEGVCLRLRESAGHRGHADLLLRLKHRADASFPSKDGRTDPDALKAALGEDAACFYLQQPNYFGQIEDARAIGEIVHAAGAKFVMGVNPIACALLPTPHEMRR